MNRVYIVHGWEGKPNYCWFPDTKRQLEERDFDVSVPAMPNPKYPVYEEWLHTLQETVGTPDENTVLVGHSLGCIAILRYLEQLPDDQRILGAVLVAGFSDDLGIPELGSFFPEPFDFPRIRSRAKHFSFIHSDDDPWVPPRYGKILQDNLGGNLIMKQGFGHFTGLVEKEDSCTELPDVIKEIEYMYGHS